MNPFLAAPAGRALRTAALTAAALVATAVPAVASQTSHHDRTGDVLRIGVEDGSSTPQPEWAQGDVQRIRAGHRTHRVGARLALREVRRRTDNSFFFRIHTPEGRFEVDGFTSQDHPHGVWYLISPNRPRPTPCTGLRHRVDYRDERVSVSVPRRCLGRPARVRVGAAAQTWIDAAEQTRLDDAYSTGQVEHITVGPWLRRASVW